MRGQNPAQIYMSSIKHIIQSSNSFRGQPFHEKTILATRRHWFVLWSRFLTIILLSLLPFGFYYFIKNLSFYEKISPLFWLLASIYFLMLWNLLWYQLMLYSLNTLTITNKRLIKHKQIAFFKYETDELDLENIQDVSVKIEGLIPALFHFGDIEIQTAGTQPKFYFNDFPNPEKIKKALMEQ